MADQKTRFVFDDHTGGRNSVDPPWMLPENQCQDAVNVDFYQTRLGRKRGGMTALSTGSFFTGVVSWLFRHVPGIDETLAELWGMDDASPPKFGAITTGITPTNVTVADALTGNAWDTTAATINGKLILAIKTATARLYVGTGGAAPAVRRAGLAAPAIPTVANSAVAGAYAATLRYYRVRWTTQSAGITIRRSEPGPSQSFTPSGGFTAAIVTRPTAAGESETHWEVEASIDNVSFYRIATVILATTTYSDSALITTYNLSPLSQLTGTFTLQKPYKFVAADQNRVLGFGSWTATDKQSRIEYSAVIGSLDTSDEERVDTTVGYYADLDEMDSGVPTGLCGPVYGSFFAFKDKQVWMGTPTGNVDKPFDWKAISKTVGAIDPHAITTGEDANGNPTLYWMSRRGPYRWGIFGIEYIGRLMEDYVTGTSSTVTLQASTTMNLAATKVKAVAMWFPDKRQVWYWWPTGTSNDPNNGFIYNVQTGGWSRVPSTDLWANVRCAAMFSNTIGGASAMSRDLKPYVGQTGGNDRLWKADSTATSDNSTLYQAYVITRLVEPGGPGFYGEVGDAVLLMKGTGSGAQATITDDVLADFGLGGASTGTVLSGATRTQQRIVGTGLGQVQWVQHTIGDAAAFAGDWSLERLVVPHMRRDAIGE